MIFICGHTNFAPTCIASSKSATSVVGLNCKFWTEHFSTIHLNALAYVFAHLSGSKKYDNGT